MRIIKLFILSQYFNTIKSMQRGQRPKCRYYAQGRCAYGTQCRFSHDGFLQIHLIRHAESVFNSYSDKMQGIGFFSEEAKIQFQLNQKLIDCGLTQTGIKQAQQIFLPSESYTLKKKKKQHQIISYKLIDLVFVSPLNRALQTTRIILRQNKIKARQIIVLPELSQVLSKVCDFSLSTEDKKKTYEKFNFQQLDRLQKQLNQRGKFWQDQLLDGEHHQQVIDNQKDGKRYMKILQEVFPTPLQNSEKCFDRTMLALEKMKDIARRQSASKILVVSHNRILKYICGRQTSGRAPSFQNCEVRKVLIQTQ